MKAIASIEDIWLWAEWNDNYQGTVLWDRGSLYLLSIWLSTDARYSLNEKISTKPNPNRFRLENILGKILHVYTAVNSHI
jgi:hypothetical protein